MTAAPWEWKVPKLASSRWADYEHIEDIGQFDALIGIYCDRDHQPWLLGSLIRHDNQAWQHVPFYPTGDGHLILVNRNIRDSLTKLHGDQPFAMPTLDLPIDDWLTDLEAGRSSENAPQLSADEIEALQSLPTHDARHVMLNNKVNELSRLHLRLRCRECRATVDRRMESLTNTLDQLAESGVPELSLGGLRSALARRTV